MINTNIKKQYQQTTGLIQRLNKSQRSFVPESVSVCCLQVCLTWRPIHCQTETGNRVKRVQILQDIPVRRMKMGLNLERAEQGVN